MRSPIRSRCCKPCVPTEPSLVEEIQFERAAGAPARLRVHFRYRAPGASVACSVDLVAGAVVPRPAWLEIDGLRAERRIRVSDYSMELADGGRSVPLPDPLTRHLARFAESLRATLAGAAPPDPERLARAARNARFAG